MANKLKGIPRKILPIDQIVRPAILETTKDHREVITLRRIEKEQPR